MEQGCGKGFEKALCTSSAQGFDYSRSPIHFRQSFENFHERVSAAGVERSYEFCRDLEYAGRCQDASFLMRNSEQKKGFEACSQLSVGYSEYGLIAKVVLSRNWVDLYAYHLTVHHGDSDADIFPHKLVIGVYVRDYFERCR